MVDIASTEGRITEVLGEQRPLQSVLITCDTSCKDGRGTKVVIIIQIKYPSLWYIVWTIRHEVVFVEDGSECATIAIHGEAHFPDALTRVTILPNVSIVVHPVGVGVTRSLLQGVVLALDHLGSVLDGIVVAMHI